MASPFTLGIFSSRPSMWFQSIELEDTQKGLYLLLPPLPVYSLFHKKQNAEHRAAQDLQQDALP